MMMHSFLGDNLFDQDWTETPLDREFFGKGNFLYGKHGKNLMKTDVRETGDKYEADIDLPGFRKDEIKIELERGYLTVSASQRREKEEKDEKGKYLRQERYAGTMSRSYYVGDNLTAADIKAKYENGILTISLPKKMMESVGQKSHIQIEG